MRKSYNGEFKKFKQHTILRVIIVLRKYVIYKCLKNLCKNIKTEANNDIDIGFSAETLSKNLKIARSNVSSDLNSLYKEGLVYKIEGRPTLYLDKEWVIEHQYSIVKSKGNDNSTQKSSIVDSFIGLIGYEGSLSSQIKQAKAAVLYPPNGLPTLILGETGTGKTMFADYMYKFGVENRILKEKSPFISFNCADYANNPQLLMAILFGSAKGAYTGSESNKNGLIEEANEGILFLDEVHRLPPEGQEMLFTIMDKNKFRRLGDTLERNVRVLIIAATTEPAKSALLETFYRRFPIIIGMPSLKERPVKERLMLVSYFFNKEALRVSMPIKVSVDAMTALALYISSANVGAIKSNIELIVSRGYMDYLINRDCIRITFNYLSENIRNVLLHDKNERQELIDIIGYEDKVFFGDRNIREDEDNEKSSFGNDVYIFLDQKFDEYKKLSLNKEKLKDNLYKDLEEYFIGFNRGLLSKGYKESELSKFVDKKIIELLRIISMEVQDKFNFEIQENTYVALAFHINSMFERRAQSSSINILDVKEKHPKEYEIAVYIYNRISTMLQQKISKNEIEFISMILHLTRNEVEQFRKIPVIVIAHGEKVATNMVSVVNTLLGTKHVVGIDMSLKDKPSDILEITIDVCKKIDEGKGILLMVDMGSLKAFGSEIKKRTEINVITIDNLSMPTLLEAAHKSMLPYSTLKDVSLSVIETTRTLLMNNVNEIIDSKKSEKIIFTTCSTGKGTAAYLKKLISKALKVNCIRNVEIFEVNINDKKEDVEKIKRITGNRNIVAIAGSINPEIPNVPFINLMDFVTGKGLERLLNYVSDNKIIDLEEINKDKTMIYGAVSSTLDENLNFFSGIKLMPYIDKYIHQLEKEKNIIFNSQVYTLLAIHIGYTLERLKFGENVKDSNIDLENNSLIKEVYRDFDVILDKDEISNIELIIHEGIKK